MRASAALLAGLLASGAASAQVDDYFAKVDLDGNGGVSLPEFLERMSFAFGQMDVDGNGVLEPQEQLVPGAATLTLEEHHERLGAQFRRQDANGDGQLSRAELLAPPR
jgi:Ca2+-binding EF-hand superfamily protein